MNLKSRAVLGAVLTGALALTAAAPALADTVGKVAPTGTKPSDPARLAAHPFAEVSQSGTASESTQLRVDMARCTSLMISTITSPTAGQGLGIVPRPLTISGKAVPYTASQATAKTVGNCHINYGDIVYTGSETVGDNDVTGVATKLTSNAASCTSDPTDHSKKPLQGTIKMGIGGQTAQGVLTVAGFDAVAADTVWLTGMFTKGEFAGYALGGAVWFAPAKKDAFNKGQYLGTDPDNIPDGADIMAAARVKTPAAVDSNFLDGDANIFALSKGYSTSVLTYFGLAGCKAGPPAPGASETTNLDLIAIGAGVPNPGASSATLLGASALGDGLADVMGLHVLS